MFLRMARRQASANHSVYYLSLQCPTAASMREREGRNSQVERMLYSAWNSQWRTPAELCQGLRSHFCWMSRNTCLAHVICRHYLSAVIVLLLGGTKQTPCSSPRAGDEDLPLTASVRCPQSALAGFCSLLYDAVLSFLSYWVSSDDVSDLIVIC